MPTKIWIYDTKIIILTTLINIWIINSFKTDSIMTKTITFNDLRRIKDSLPDGSMQNHGHAFTFKQVLET